MTNTRLRFLLRGTRKTAPQHKQNEYIQVRKDSLIRIITEAYTMGVEDAKK